MLLHHMERRVVDGDVDGTSGNHHVELFVPPAAPQASRTTAVTLLMSYSTDYSIGRVCEAVNRQYGQRHGYELVSEVLPSEEMMTRIRPKKHCTWYKILLLMKWMEASLRQRKEEEEESLGSSSSSTRKRYLMWVDGDALFVDHSRSLEEIISRGAEKDLIIAEDMHPSCPINAGVFLLSVCKPPLFVTLSDSSNDLTALPSQYIYL